MLAPRWRKLRADLFHRRSRTVLAVLSLIVGIFAIGTIHLATSDVVQSFNRNFKATNPPSAVITVNSFEPALVDAVREHHAVGQVEGRQRLQVRVRAGEGKWTNFMLVAMPDFADNRVSLIEPEEGAWPPVDDALVIERAAAREIGVEIGDRVQVQVPGQAPVELEVRGMAHDFWEVPPTFGGAPRGYVTMPTIARFSGSELLNALYLRAAERPLEREQAIAVAAMVRDDVIEPAGLAVERSEIRDPSVHQIQNALAGVTTGLRLLSIFILILASVLVVNTMSALLAEQRRQIGVMKAVGATSRQIAVLYTAYAVALGLIALAIAIPASIVAGRAMASFFSRMLNFSLAPLGLPAATLAIEAGVAIGAPALAVAWTVRRAARQTVRETISDYGLSTRSNPALAAGLRRVASPTRLAIRNTFRSRARLALTLGTVGLTGALLIGLLSTDLALRQVADEVAGYTDYDVELILTEPVDVAKAGSVAAAQAGVERVEGWLLRDAFRIRPNGTENENIFLVSLPPDSTSIRPTLAAGRWLEPGDEFAVVVNEDFLREESDLEIGDEVILDVEGRRRGWTIVGAVTTQLMGPYAYVPVEPLTALIDAQGQANLLAVNLAPGVDAEAAGDDLERALLDAGIPLGGVQTNADIRAGTQSLFDLLIWTLMTVAGLLGVVAIVGVTGTLTLGVLERTREIGVLRTVGATSRAIQRGLLIEGLTLAALGWLAGALLGLPMAWLLGQAIGRAFIFKPLPVTFSWPAVGIWLIVTLVIAVIGATRPARAASRLTIQEILAYE